MIDTKPTYEDLLKENDILKRRLSEQNNSEISFNEYEEKYKSIVSILPDGVVIHQNGKIVFANDAASKIMKVKKKEDIIGKIAIEFVHPDFRELALERIKKSITEKTPAQTIEEVFIDFEGNPLNVFVTAIPFQFEGKPSMLTVFSDISTLKKTEQELIQSKERAEESENIFNDFMKYSPIYVFFKDADIRPIRLSLNYEKMIGMPINQLLGKTMDELFPSDLAKSMVADDLRILKENKVIEVEEEFNGHFYNTIKFPIHIKEKPRYLAGFTIDITERKQAEILLQEKNIELQKAKEKAEEGERLKTSFLQNISHEIRTPMNAIIGFTSFLDDPDLSLQKRQNYVSIITNSANQLLSIVNDILTISSIDTKQETVHLTKVCVNDIIFNLHSIFKPQAENKNISINFKTELSDENSKILCDSTKLTQILSNLISNALKFTKDGEIEFGYTGTGDVRTGRDLSLQFYVKDTGIGIKNEYQQIIFERFHQADTSISQKYGGTGIGLAISKGFVELLGGKIWVESEYEKGSTFYFTIPYTVET